MRHTNLSVDFCGVHFINPFVLAAAPSTDSAEMVMRGFDSGWAGAVLKTTSTKETEVSIAYPIMNSLRRDGKMIGLHNIDLISERHVEAVAEDVRRLKISHPEHIVIGSIVGSTREEWQYLARYMAEAGADLLECSLSCPQGSMIDEEIEPLGSMVSQDPRLTKKVAEWIKEAAPDTPVYIKLTSGVTDLVPIVQAVQASGAEGICLIDSVEGILGVDLETLEPLPSVQGYTSHGGYSGQAIKPIALRCVADAARAVDLPISGVGGIYDWRDALEFILLGATTVQVCTAVMHRGYDLVEELADGMSRWMERKGFNSIKEMVGLTLPRLVDHDSLPHNIPVRANIDLTRCIGCGLCYVACRDGGHQAIVWNVERKPYVDNNKCVGCGFCPQVCPVDDCILMVNI